MRRFHILWFCVRRQFRFLSRKRRLRRSAAELVDRPMVIRYHGLAGDHDISLVPSGGDVDLQRRRSSSPMLSLAHFADLPKLLALAAHDNVAVKISDACTLSREPFPYKDLWDPLGRVFDAFSFDRGMWGTDWTRAVRLLTYKQGIEAFRVTDRLSDSDRALLVGETIQRVYNWAPSKA